ncbi:MAG: glucosaminidase domain-containing protein [Gammaproteobacteria bacterium]|nr:glucosaminidase domain-containing protein [Gammaproteobacteria bacterium]
MTVNNTAVLTAAGLLCAVAGLTYWMAPSATPDFSEFPAGPERKAAFFGYLAPLIEEKNDEIRATRQDLLAWNEHRQSISWWDARQIRHIAKDYRMDGFDLGSDADWQTLLRRVDAVPASLALAQAANESAWGTSRFSQQGFNYYGQWCFEDGCGMVPELRGPGKNHEVATFDSPADSVASYIDNLNTHDAYHELRTLRSTLAATQQPVTGIALAAGLENYSERGAAYIEELRAMILSNELAHYDTPQPHYDTLN